MKKISKISLVLLAVLSLLFVSCKKEYPTPPIPVLPVGDVYTIDDILALESGYVFPEDVDASVYGIVTADEQSGNLYKAAFIQDRTTGKALELYMNATSGVRIGDSIRVYLPGVTYTVYNNLPQLSGFEPDGHVIILANNRPIEPIKTTIANINAGQHLAQLIKLENVKFSDQNTFADPTTYGNRTLIDPTDPTNSVIVRTSNYANFANDSLPQGTGNVVAIASVYGTTWQLYIRSATELEFEGYNPGGDDNGLPYFQDFTSSFGTYTTYSVEGDQVFEIDYSTAKMTGYANGANYVNEDWLLSAPVALTDVEHVKVSVNYVAQYQNANTEDITLQISKNYVAGTNPLEADWTQMNVTYPNTSGWSDFQTVETSLDEFLGETVTVAIKYTSSATQARTLEVKYIVVQEGEVTGGGGGGGGQGGEVQTLPYTQSFTTEFGTYITKDVLGPQSWEIDYSTAKMTGYVNSSYNANEDWLISSPVAITGVSDAKMTMVYIGRYFNNINEEITVWASTDYTYGDDPTTATWTQVATSLSEGSNWTTFLTAEIALTDYVGQTVTLAVKYLSTDSKAGTMEIQSITIEEGSGVNPGPTPGPGTVTGDGSRENPYTANDIILLGIETSDGNKYWVKDYIVGVIDGSYVYQYTSNTDVMTNLILSSNANTNNDSECIPVQLPAGAVREGLNLVNNPGNLGQEVLLYGTLEKYFRIPGVKNVTYAEINGNSFGTDPGGSNPPGPGTSIFSETFANGQGDFVIENVLMPQELTYVWSHAANYSCMKASAYVGQAYETESWLVSPYISLDGVTSATLTFEQAVNYASPQGVLSVMITTEYVDTIDGIEWEELTLSNWPAGSDWTFVTSTADLTPWAGQQVTIAFRYTSTDSASATWEVKNIVIE